MSSRERRALVTGASKGIGRAVAARLASDGYEVIGTSRDPATCRALDGVEFVPLDLRSTRSIDACVRRVGAIDLLVNNAGESQIGAAEEIPMNAIRELFETNLFGAIELTQRVLPGMRERRSGVVVNVGSLIAEFPIPFQSSYASTKAALRAFTRSLRAELAPFDVRVILVEPADIRTSIVPRSFEEPRSAYAQARERVRTSIARSMSSAVDPEVVANKIASLVSGPDRSPRYAVGGHASFLVFVRRFLSDRRVDALIDRTYSRSSSESS